MEQRPMTLVETDTLTDLAEQIHAEVQRGRDGLTQAVESYFAIGHRLLEARRQLISDNDYGAWVRAQDFGFSQQWAWTLRAAAEHEAIVRPVVTTQVVTTGAPNIRKAVKVAMAGNGGGRSDRPDSPGLGHPTTNGNTPTTFAAIVIDPPWQYDNTATRGAAEDHYPTMPLNELAALTIPGTDNSHLYLWVTNGFIREGFNLLDAWNYRYKTTLTWCKPQIGMGNYFRNNTEHVLFAIRGSLPTTANDIPTWFVADRTRHSAKPECFYDIVERSSPGPYMEMFARRRRFGWHTWGNEA